MLQPKLLRILDSQCFRRVGGRKEIEVDVRIVAATHRDLPRMVAAGEFREDLYFRLNVGSIDVPPLCQRQADIPLLARHFLDGISARMGVAQVVIDAAALELLQRYAWPGNIRELRNVMERAALLGGGRISSDDLPADLVAAAVMTAAATTSPPSPSARIEVGTTLADIERDHILRVIHECAGNRSKAAERLGISRPTLRGKLREYGLDSAH